MRSFFGRCHLRNFRGCFNVVRLVNSNQDPGGAMKQADGSFSPAQMTGRDGGVDFATKTSAVEAAQDQDRFAHILGCAVIDVWGSLPQAMQELLFERAVVLGHQTERDEMLREQLAKFLHDHHARTAR
jgi:hypothetical protein